MAAEVPQTVHRAIRLMYAGLAVTVLDVVLTLIAVGRFGHDQTVDTALGHPAAASHANSMEGAAVIGAVADFLGLACWIWLALATQRGQGWPRVTGAVLLGIYTVVTLFVVFGTRGDPGATFTTIVVWALGLAALIPLRSQQARQFFFAWRKR